jgi:hypothetical protein
LVAAPLLRRRLVALLLGVGTIRRRHHGDVAELICDGRSTMPQQRGDGSMHRDMPTAPRWCCQCIEPSSAGLLLSMEARWLRYIAALAAPWARGGWYGGVVPAGVAWVRRSHDVCCPGGVAEGADLRRHGSWSCGRGTALMKTLAGGAGRLDCARAGCGTLRANALASVMLVG